MLRKYVPTLTAVRPSSSDALLPPVLLCELMRLLLLVDGLIMALIGRGGMEAAGDEGGEVAIMAARAGIGAAC